eukprot:scaffold413_cov134-Isochrysis_galbana.AAC.2
MLPPVLLNFANRLSGYSTNIVRLECQGSKTVGPNNQVRFTLPANALLNMKSFAVHGTAEATATNSRFARLPPDLVSMFDRVEIAIGGVQLSAGCSHQNVLMAAQRALMGSDKGGNLGFTHGEMVRNTPYYSGTTITGGSESYPFAAQGFGGLLDSEIVLDSSLVGDVVITLHTAPASIISVSNNVDTDANYTAHSGNGVGTYTIANLFATIEVMAVSDPAYETLSKQIIAQKGFIEHNFKNYHSSVQTHNGASRFNVSTQSLDRIWCTFRDANAIGPNRPPTRKSGFGWVGHPRLGGAEMYLPAAFRFRRLQGDNITMQLSLNGALYPQFPARIDDWMFITNQSLPQGKIIERDLSSSAYTQDCHVLCARLNLPGSEQARTVSGLDTRGISLVGQLMSTNDNAGLPSQCLIFSECTSSLRVGPGRTIEVIM